MTVDKTGKHTGSIICPNCSTAMQEIRRYDADIDYCPSCKGVWLDRGEIDKIAMAQNRIDEEHYRRYHRDRDYDDYDDDTITITEGTEGEEVYLATYLTLTR
ncbi:MAG: zf-TFIIB domain-containing protein [Thermoproteota archaeon]|nr:zf-TFIIB domain-containing protein [Thermoproteota archaeon]